MNKKIFYILIILVLIYIIYKFKPKDKTTMETENNSNTKLKFDGNKDNYIALMKPFALQLEKEYKIPYKFILAQTGIY
jgi:flagellum-specific peptidoglycan hydrolase FlgJ